MKPLTLSLPPPLNQAYSTVRGYIYKTRIARDWEEKAGWELKKQWKEDRFDCDCYCGISLFLKRDRDIDSSLKLLLDLLQRQKVIKNDILISHLNIKKFMDKENPRCEVEVQKI